MAGCATGLFCKLHENKKGVIADSFCVGIPGFEPGTPCSQSRCATGLRYIPNSMFFRGEGGIRTLVTTFEVRRFSKPLVSATHPPHLDFIMLIIKYLG